MTNKYTYWLFYIDKDIGERIPNVINYDTCLYAYTDNYELCQKFMNIHNMAYFVILEKSITKEEIRYLTKTERDKYIVERKILTKDRHGNKEYVTTCMTLEEYKIVKACTSSKIMECIYQMTTASYPKEMFNKRIREILTIVGFFDISKMKLGQIPVIADSEKIIIDAAKKPINLYVDELTIYSSVFYLVLKVGD